MAFVTDSSIKSEEAVDDLGDVKRTEDVTDGPYGGVFVDEIDTGVVGGDVDVAVGVGGEAAGEGREVLSVLSERFKWSFVFG